jgi:hypothetical protein
MSLSPASVVGQQRGGERRTMRIVLKRTLSNDDMGEMYCGICSGGFWLGACTADAVSERNVHLGHVCPSCVERGVEHMKAELEERARRSARIAAEDAEHAAEGFTEVPALEEFLMLEKVYQAPRYRTGQEAQDARGQE